MIDKTSNAKVKLSRGRILVTTRNNPFAGHNGAGEYLSSVVGYLKANGWQIDLAWTDPGDLRPTQGVLRLAAEANRYERIWIKGCLGWRNTYFHVETFWLPQKARWLHRIKKAIGILGVASHGRTPPNSNNSSKDGLWAASKQTDHAEWNRLCAGEEANFIQNAIRHSAPDVVLASYSWLVPACTMAEGPPVAVLTYDVRHRQLELCDGVVREVLNDEVRVEESRQLSGAQLLIAIQSCERDKLRSMFPKKSVCLAPLPLHARQRAVSRNSQTHLLFVGSANGANAEGLTWFLKQVWPLLKTMVPGVRFLVVGKVCDLVEKSIDDRIEWLGKVDDLGVAYSRSAVVVAPVTRGSGLKVKVIEALSFGCPCVTTSVGADGLPDLAPALRVADSAEDFAQATAHLVRSNRADISAILENFYRRFSPEYCFAPLERTLRALVDVQDGEPILRGRQ